MKKILLAISVMFALTACNSGSSTASYTPPPSQPSQPTQPTEPQPNPDPEQGVPDVGTGSVNYTPSCLSGFATIIYVFRSDSTIDQNSFVIVHTVDGQRQDIDSGTVFSNGSISKMEHQFYISPNPKDVQRAHQITVSFVSDNISQVNSFGFIQPACENDGNQSTAMSLQIIL